MTEANQRVILTIEDDVFVRKSLALFLEKQGYEVLQAGDGEEGLAIWRQHRPELVLTDLRLPKKDGLEILATLKEEQPELPVIIVSGMGTMGDVIKALQLGAWDYVSKPITDMTLLSYAIQKALNQADLISENKQYQNFLEEEVARRTNELHQAQKLEAVGTLAGGIAHDFNNILSAIIGYSDLVLLKYSSIPPLCDDLEKIRQAGQRAKELVAQILTFARKSDIEHHPIEIAPIVKEVLKLLRATIPATVEIRQQVYEGPEKVMADAIEIHQVVMNLCTNAFHALAQERGTIEVTLHLYDLDQGNQLALPAGCYLCLKVTDNGCGMDSQLAQRVFDPFFTTKKKDVGTGLGLAVVHGIVQSCQGAVMVESEPGQGSTFTVCLPVVTATDVAPQQETAATPMGRQERILWVDDEEALRDLAERMLVFWGYRPTCIASGQEALEVMAKEPFDLLVTDQTMPGMPGTELVQAVKSRWPELPIIICTGYSSMVDEAKAKALGADGYLEKPLELSLVANMIRSLLDKRS